MKTLLIGINSQFVHTNLAVMYLKAACDNSLGEIKILDFSINDPIRQIFSSIMEEKPDIAAFSCYIWNIEYVVKLSEDLKKACPKLIIIAGGPEVSFDNGGLLESKDFVDYIIAGDGEEKLPLLLKRIQEGTALDAEEIKQLKSFSVVSELDTLQSPYEFIKKNSMVNRIAYLEASRGCPFHCSYCMSSVTGSVRRFKPEKVYKALSILVDSGTRIIKFVDRTFNSSEIISLGIWEHIQKYNDRGVVFHFEIDPGLMTEKMLDCLEKMPQGLIQLEAGIQSVHSKTLEAVERPKHIEKALVNIERIISFENIHVHVDLIAGLPYENYDMFRESFNTVYKLKSHHFQLGFLKLLRGSGLREKAEQYGIKYSSYPPYEIISNNYITASELLLLKDIATCIDLFYNSGRFVTSLIAISTACTNADKCSDLSDNFAFFEALAIHMRQEGYLDRSIKPSDLYEILYVFIKDRAQFNEEFILESLRFDYLRSMKNVSMPDFFDRNQKNKKSKKEMIQTYHNELERVLPRLKENTLDRIWNQIYIDKFNLPSETGYPPNSIIVFDFGDISSVTNLAGAYFVRKQGDDSRKQGDGSLASFVNM